MVRRGGIGSLENRRHGLPDQSSLGPHGGRYRETKLWGQLIMKKQDVDTESVTDGGYAAPRLKIYGTVTRLTAAGTGTLAENGNPGTCSQTSSRRPC